MNALQYLLTTQLKNRILALRKKPALLILYIVAFGFLGFFVVYNLFFGGVQNVNYADERIIYLVVAALGFLFLVTYTNTGLSTGSTLFTMSDVGLLFVAPISTRKILVYGLISSIGKALLAAFFILFQVGNLQTNFGYGLKEIFGLFFIYVIIVFIGQLFSIGIYLFSNGNVQRKRGVKMILYGSLTVLAIAVLLFQKQEQANILEVLYKIVDSTWFGYIPIAGWAVMFFKGIVEGAVVSILLSFAFFIVLAILIIRLLTIGEADYYEDVLLSTEYVHHMKQAAKEGGKAPRKRKKKVKIKDDADEMGHAQGAMTIYHKHLLEMKRSSRFIFIDGMTVFLSIGVALAGYQFKSIEGAYGILAFAIYLLYFFTIMGKLKNELMKPYIYMIPASSKKKVFAASLTSIMKISLDAIVIFSIFAISGGIDPISCMFFALAYTASGVLFIGLTILYQRVLGGQPNQGVQLMLGLCLLLLLLSPGIGLSIAAALLLPGKLLFLCTLPYSILCIVIAVIIFVSCGDLIDKSEYTGKAL